MHIQIRAGNVRLPRAHATGLAERLRGVFARLADRIVRIVVRLGETTPHGAASRQCTMEVHLQDGEVMFVNERRRKLGSLLRRATERAWKAAAVALAHPGAASPKLALPVRPPKRRA
ncbi:MAG: hypothetical protein ACK5NY_06505 [Burkholderiaceae bacterium]|jgi:hypothetical protein